jgi:hypothetical protein
VAYALGVSVRQATRDHHQAVDTLTELLWQTYQSTVALYHNGVALDQGERLRDSAYRDELAEEIANVAEHAKAAPIWPKRSKGLSKPWTSSLGDKASTFVLSSPMPFPLSR